jgi:hypothetical protein
MYESVGGAEEDTTILLSVECAGCVRGKTVVVSSRRTGYTVETSAVPPLAASQTTPPGLRSRKRQNFPTKQSSLLPPIKTAFD